MLIIGAPIFKVFFLAARLFIPLFELGEQTGRPPRSLFSSFFGFQNPAAHSDRCPCNMTTDAIRRWSDPSQTKKHSEMTD
jgi:hypothetical protein